MNVNTTKVIFRVWIGTGDVLALFPEGLGTADPYTCLSYSRVGQHSAADPVGCMLRTRRAFPPEYRSLLKELEARGYKLEIRHKLLSGFLVVRRQKLKEGKV